MSLGFSDALRFASGAGRSPAAIVINAVESELGELYRFAEREATGTADSPPPETFAYLWHWFLEARNFHKSIRDPLRPSELESWARLRGLDLEPFEATTLLHLDIIFRASLPKPKGR